MLQPSSAATVPGLLYACSHWIGVNRICTVSTCSKFCVSMAHGMVCCSVKCCVLSVAPDVVSAPAFLCTARIGRVGSWSGGCVWGLLWLWISIPSAHSAKTAALLWDHVLNSRASWMLNMLLTIQSPSTLPSLQPLAFAIAVLLHKHIIFCN